MTENDNKLIQETHEAVIKLGENFINLADEVKETKLAVKGIHTDMNLQAQKTTRLETTTYGVPNTDDKGLCGYVSQIEKRVGKVESRQVKLAALIAGASGAVGGGIAKFISWLGLGS